MFNSKKVINLLYDEPILTRNKISEVTGIKLTTVNGIVNAMLDKEIITETARTDEFTGDIVQSGNTWGYGKIDAWAGLKECLELNSIDGVEPISEKVVLYKYSNNNSSISLLFTKECNNVTISIYDISGKIVSINSYMGIAQGEEKNITLNNFGSGIYIIRIKSDNITETFKLIKH